MKRSLSICLFLFTASCGAPDLSRVDSPYFDGQQFQNVDGIKRKKSFWKVLKWRLNTKNRAKWPKKINNPQYKIKTKNNKPGELSVTFINHATTLIQIDGVNILTDPVWSERVSPVTWAGPKRHQKPGVAFEDMPKIDLILISHNHFDHMDIETLERFAKRDQSKILFGLGSKYYLKKTSQKNSIELDWNQSHQTNNLEVTFLPANHWSKRTLSDTNKSLWGGFAIEGQHKVYFAGDTGYGNHFKEAYKKFGTFDLSLIPIGAYEPRWFMKYHHMNPEDAVKAHLDLHSKHSLGIHHSTFQLTDEGIKEPREKLETLKKEMNLEFPFVSLDNGETLTLKELSTE